jgi:hypothetical protein
VGDAGDRPRQQFLLPEDLGELRGDAGLEVVLAGVLVDRGLTRADQFDQKEHAFGGEGQNDCRQQKAKGQPDQSLRVHARLPGCSYRAVDDLVTER